MGKVTAVNDITAINNYAGQYRQEIITSVVNNLDVVQDLTVLRNLRAPRVLPKYVGKKGLRPYDFQCQPGVGSGRYVEQADHRAAHVDENHRGPSRRTAQDLPQ